MCAMHLQQNRVQHLVDDVHDTVSIAASKPDSPRIHIAVCFLMPNLAPSPCCEYKYRQSFTPARSFILCNSVPMSLSMYVCTQNLLVRLSCQPQQAKHSVQYSLPVTPCTADQHMDSVFGCHVVYLPPYCAGVTQHTFPL